MRIRALIVDDEALGRERMRMLLAKHDGVEVCAEAAGGQEAVRLIVEYSPDLIFLDIQMPDLNGFGVVDQLEAMGHRLPIVVFVTAYDTYAIKAFEVNAVDYLLKPVQADRLRRSIERAGHLIQSTTADDISSESQNIIAAVSRASTLLRIEVRSLGRTDYVPVEEILWLKADGNYIEIHVGSAASQLARITLSELEDQLDPGQFMRVSRSAILKLSAVERLQSKRRGHVAVLKDGTRVPVTRSFAELQNRLKYIG